MARLPAIRPAPRKARDHVKLTDVVDRRQFGPAMQKLTEQQQNFVVAYWQTTNATEAARIAGYSVSNNDTTKAQAWRLTHDPRIKEAIREFGGNVLSAEGVKKAVTRLLGLMDSDNEKIALDATKTFLDRIGIVATTQHNVNVEVTLTQQEKLSKLAEYAATVGVDPKQVLGNVIDVDYQELDDEDEG